MQSNVNDHSLLLTPGLRCNFDLETELIYRDLISDVEDVATEICSSNGVPRDQVGKHIKNDKRQTAKKCPNLNFHGTEPKKNGPTNFHQATNDFSVKCSIELNKIVEAGINLQTLTKRPRNKTEFKPSVLKQHKNDSVTKAKKKRLQLSNTTKKIVHQKTDPDILGSILAEIDKSKNSRNEFGSDSGLKATILNTDPASKLLLKSVQDNRDWKIKYQT